MKKITIILLLLSLLIIGVIAVTYDDIAFSSGSRHEVASLVERTNYTTYIDIPKAYIGNISIMLKGVI